MRFAWVLPVPSPTGTKGSEIRAELYLNGPNAKQGFAILEKRKESIEKELGFSLTWRNPEDKAMCRLYTRLDADVENEKLWPKHFAWLKEKLEIMHTVFSPLMRQIRKELPE